MLSTIYYITGLWVFLIQLTIAIDYKGFREAKEKQKNNESITPGDAGLIKANTFCFLWIALALLSSHWWVALPWFIVSIPMQKANKENGYRFGTEITFFDSGVILFMVLNYFHWHLFL